MNALILGAGKSGLSAKSFLEKRGYGCFLYDDRDGGNIPDVNFDICVISPGISVNHELAIKYKEILISELDLAFRFMRPKRLIVVTGTNGKTSVVNMLHTAIRGSILCGNVGTPATSVDMRKKTVIAEVSSFQLEIIPKHMNSDIAVILNITPDHFDRHGRMENYIECKNRLNGKVNVLNGDDEICMKLDKQNVKYFHGKDYTEQNVNAVKAVCDVLKIRANIKNVKLPHRIEFVAETEGVRFFDDSKATNIGATLAAVKSFGTDTSLILGGTGKGQDFTKLFDKLPNTVKHIFVIGKASREIISANGNKFNIKKCKDMSQAVECAYKSGDKVVLLSPACASFDMYKNYEQRGEHFMHIVDLISRY